MAHRSARVAAGILLAAAPYAAVPSPAASQARYEPAFTDYGADQGMSNTRVTALLQDDAGFLWIGTHDGLLRFDGRTFKAYRARLEDATSLSDDYIVGLAAADSGRIWVGAQRGDSSASTR